MYIVYIQSFERFYSAVSNNILIFICCPVQVRVLSISKPAFEEVLGPLSSIIDEDRKRR